MTHGYAAEYDVRALTTRIVELECERSDAREEAASLFAVQRAFTGLAVERTPVDAIARMLRAAHTALGFSRAVFYRVDRERGIEAQWQLDGSDAVEASEPTYDERAGGALVAILRDPTSEGVGRAGELSAPMIDVRGWYAVAPIERSNGTYGILYVDGHASAEPPDWLIGLVRSLATVAAVAIDNALLLTKTRELADRDPLTGLFNRRAFQERLLLAIQDAEHRSRSLTYIMIDVDDFKRINDSFGHAFGDTTLRKLASTLAASSREHDVVGRYAGDEFVILLANVDPPLARALVERLSKTLDEADLRCSIGAALFPNHAHDAATLMAAADAALYETKRRGKNGYRFASDRR